MNSHAAKGTFTLVVLFGGCRIRRSTISCDITAASTEMIISVGL